MTNNDILQAAVKQSAIESNCAVHDFFAGENKVVMSSCNPEARRYLQLPFLCDFTSYGDNIVASVSPEFYSVACDYINRFSVEHCFETPNLHILMDRLRPMGANVCYMAEYFLPDINKLKPIKCKYKTKLLYANDFDGLYLPRWSNALCSERRSSDVLCIGAYDGDRLIGLAGCSADCGTMWQIGIDVLPEYRRQGVASALTSTIAIEVLSKGVIPFYCCAWSNLPSAKNAIKSGFVPSWVQMTVKPDTFINSINNV